MDRVRPASTFAPGTDRQAALGRFAIGRKNDPALSRTGDGGHAAIRSLRDDAKAARRTGAARLSRAASSAISVVCWDRSTHTRSRTFASVRLLLPVAESAGSA